MRRLGRLHLKILKKKLSVVFKQTGSDNDLLPKYTIYVYIYIILVTINGSHEISVDDVEYLW